MVSDEALKKLQEQIAAWPMTQRFVVQQLIEDYRRNREDLRVYEGTGLEPETIIKAKDALEYAYGNANRIIELAEADKDGRLVVLPCKVGDVIYGFHGEWTILPMVAKWIETYDDRWAVAAQYTPIAPEFYMFSDFGKTVFLTREEAEAALEAMKDE